MTDNLSKDLRTIVTNNQIKQLEPAIPTGHILVNENMLMTDLVMYVSARDNKIKGSMFDATSTRL
jgi:hypothetical protein